MPRNPTHNLGHNHHYFYVAFFEPQNKHTAPMSI